MDRLIQLEYRGDSMSPFFRQGDVIFFSHPSQEKVRRGDIIAYRSGEDIIIHRIVAISGTTERSFMTKPDAGNARDDGWVSEDEIVGRVVALLRGRKVFDLETLPLKITNQVCFFLSRLNLIYFWRRVSRKIVSLLHQRYYRKTQPSPRD